MKLFSLQKSLKILTGVKFAIFILTLIALASSLGSFLEQEESLNFYKENYPLEKPIFGFITWKIIIFLGLDHVYKTWWFLALIFLFGLSLVLCSFLQQLPSLKIARRCQFFRTTEQFYRLKISTTLNTFSFNKILDCSLDYLYLFNKSRIFVSESFLTFYYFMKLLNYF